MATIGEKKGKGGEKKVFEKKVVVPRTATQQQSYKLAKLLNNPAKPVFIPDKPVEKLPRVFNPPEFVRNIWGSSAGAGSGDFHVYRGVRRREYARQKFLKEKYARDDADEEFQKRLVTHKAAALDKTAKKRAKRLKKKGKKGSKGGDKKESQPGNAAAGGQDVKNDEEDDEESDGDIMEYIAAQLGDQSSADGQSHSGPHGQSRSGPDVQSQSEGQSCVQEQSCSEPPASAIQR